MSASTMNKARKALSQLGQVIYAWREVDQIRASLPAKLRRQLPASRYNVVVGILSQLKARGAVHSRGVDGFGAIPVAAIAAVAIVGVAGAAVIVATWPAIQREHRAAMAARSKLSVC